MKTKLEKFINRRKVYFMLFTNKLIKIISRNSLNHKEMNDLEYFKNKAFFRLALFFIFAGLIPVIYGAYMFIREGNTLIGILEILTYIVVFLMIASKRISLLKKRILFIASFLALGLLLLFFTGPMGAGYILVVASFALAGCLLNNKQTIIFIIFNLMVFIIISILLNTGTLDILPISQYKPAWFIIAITAQAIGIVIMLTNNNINNDLEKLSKNAIKSKEIIQKSEIRYRTIFNQVSLGIYNISPDSNFIDANKKFCEMLGYGIEELKKLTVFDITHPDDIDMTKEIFSSLSNNNDKEISKEKRYIKKDKSIVYALLSVTLIKDENNKPRYTVAIVQDITEQKKLEEEKLALHTLLNHKQRLEAIGTLAGGVAHEINNPLNGIMNYGQLIIDSSTNNSESTEFAKEIIHETERIGTIVKNLLQFSRAEKQQHSYASVNDLIDSTLSLIKTIIRRDQIDLQIDIPEDMPKIKCRSQQIQQVIMNLLTNARDALNEKYAGYDEDKIIKMYSEIYDKDSHKWLRLTVEDHGNGIPKDVMGKIFEPFYSTKDKDKGTGLGLSISYGIVKEHNGELTYKTKEGCYTKFFLDLPFENSWKLET